MAENAHLRLGFVSRSRFRFDSRGNLDRIWNDEEKNSDLGPGLWPGEEKRERKKFHQLS